MGLRKVVTGVFLTSISFAWAGNESPRPKAPAFDCRAYLQHAGLMPVAQVLDERAARFEHRVFINFETTGLNDYGRPGKRKDLPLEVAVVVTNINFSVEAQYSTPIHQPASKLTEDRISPFARKMHTDNKLLEQIRNGEGRKLRDVEDDLIKLLTPFRVNVGRGEPKIIVHGIKPDFDRRWIEATMPRLAAMMYHQDHDVITLRNFVLDAFGLKAQKRPYGPRGLDEVLDAIREYQTYMNIIRQLADVGGTAVGKVMDRHNEIQVRSDDKIAIATTIDHYTAKDPKSYDDRTKDFATTDIAREMYAAFENELRSFVRMGHPQVLDVGCGTGRDAREFASRGMKVFAYDASPTFIDFARRNTTSNADLVTFRTMTFDEFDAGRVDGVKYDGIWAMSSLIHSPSKEHLIKILRTHFASLRSGGVAFFSFLKGEGQKTQFQVAGPSYTVGRTWMFFSDAELKEFFEENFGNEVYVLRSSVEADFLNRQADGKTVQWSSILLRKR